MANTTTMTLEHVELVGSHGITCDNCGHDIKWLYHIKNNGKRMIVGSECAGHLLNAPKVKEAKARANRAARQWRAQKPATREGETREQYIARRMAEMQNAWIAHLAWKRLPDAYSRACRTNSRAKRLLGTLGVDRTKLDAWKHWNSPWWPFDKPELDRKAIGRIERRYRANRFDFVRPSWEAKKI